MKKEALRKEYLAKRQALSDQEYSNFNKGLFEKFFESVDVSSVRVLHTFLPIEKFREPDTWPIIKRIQKEFPNLAISLPRVNLQNGELENFYFESEQQLIKSKWGIWEPQGGRHTHPQEIDLVLVPLVCFDQSGNRVGYGKGYYDKLVEKCRSDCKTAGLSFFPPVDSIEDLEWFDKKLSQVITPEKNFTF